MSVMRSSVGAEAVRTLSVIASAVVVVISYLFVDLFGQAPGHPHLFDDVSSRAFDVAGDDRRRAVSILTPQPLDELAALADHRLAAAQRYRKAAADRAQDSAGLHDNAACRL